jgi:transcription antitermination factor NusG
VGPGLAVKAFRLRLPVFKPLSRQNSPFVLRPEFFVMPDTALRTTLQWYALYVRVRHERKVEMQLTGRGYEAFLPSYLSNRRWSDRYKDVDLPLFPGYVFCRMSVADRVGVLAAHGVVRIVGFGADYIPVDEAEIVALQRAMEEQVQCEPVPFVSAGERVRIVAGPLTGVEGILMEYRHGRRLILTISLLQRSVSVEVERSQLESISTPGIKTPGSSDVRFRWSA